MLEAELEPLALKSKAVEMAGDEYAVEAPPSKAVKSSKSRSDGPCELPVADWR